MPPILGSKPQGFNKMRQESVRPALARRVLALLLPATACCLISACARRADMFPSLSLYGSIGLQSTEGGECVRKLVRHSDFIRRMN